MWEREKLLVSSNFSFSHSVFKRLILQICKNQGLVWEWVNIPNQGGLLHRKIVNDARRFPKTTRLDNYELAYVILTK